MSEQDIPEKKLKKLTGAKDLSTAIEKLEKKKQVMEEDLKEEAQSLLQNLNPITLLDQTLKSVDESSPAKHSLFKESIAFGAGYLSKKNLIHQFKSALIKTFSRSVTRSNLSLKAANDNQEDTKMDDNPTDNKKENSFMNSQVEKVKAKPEVLPEPTYWPFFLAMGLAFLGWGLLTTWMISLAGFIIIIVSLTGWINILRHE